jgi:hypothetical protein
MSGGSWLRTTRARRATVQRFLVVEHEHQSTNTVIRTEYIRKPELPKLATEPINMYGQYLSATSVNGSINSYPRSPSNSEDVYL